MAVSDPERRVATPLCVLDASVLHDPRALATLASDYEVGGLVVGLPLSLDGTEGPQARHVREVGTRIAESLGMPVEFTDERLSSAEASRSMSAAGSSAKASRGKVDMVAAALFLQSFLDRTSRRPDGAEDEEPWEAAE